MEQLYFVSVLLGIIILIMVMQYINSRRNDKLYVSKLNKEYGTINRSSYKYERLKSAPGYYLRHHTERNIDDITWNDLSMDELFATIDTTQSSFGCEVLYHTLRQPLYSVEEINKRREMLRFWNDNPKLRSQIQLLLHNIGKIRKYSVYDYIDSLNQCKNKSSKIYLFRIVLLLLSIASFFFLQGYGVILFILILLANLFSYYSDKAKIAPYVTVIDDVYNLYLAAEGIDRCLKREEADFELEVYLKNLKALKRFGGNSASNPLVLLSNTIGFLFFSDLLRFNTLKSKVLSAYSDVDGLIYKIGYIDACISISSYIKASEENICEPNFNTKSNVMITGLVHPLIKNAVDNDIDIKRAILLTGSNASGKSTFLKSIALAMHMAQSVTFVFAKDYNAPLIRIMSSMSLKDDICQGDSYYMAEIKSVKRIFDEQSALKDTDLKLVCFVDELLRGTNTTERIAAATQVLTVLNRQGAVVCAATHDLELTYILDELYDNYHFKEELCEGDVSFSYKLKSGPASSRNAIALLKNLGYSEELIQNAEKMVSEYERSGIWISGKV